MQQSRDVWRRCIGGLLHRLAFWLEIDQYDLIGWNSIRSFFPLRSIAYTAWEEMDQIIRGSHSMFAVGHDPFGHFFANWWGGFGGFNELYLLAIMVCAVAYTLPWRGVANRDRAPPLKIFRWRDIVVGILFVAFGNLIALARYVGVVGEVQNLTSRAKSLNHPPLLASAALLQSQIWNIVLQSSLPYIIVGGLLLTPSRWPKNPADLSQARFTQDKDIQSKSPQTPNTAQ